MTHRRLFATLSMARPTRIVALARRSATLRFTRFARYRRMVLANHGRTSTFKATAIKYGYEYFLVRGADQSPEICAFAGQSHFTGHLTDPVTPGKGHSTVATTPATTFRGRGRLSLDHPFLCTIHPAYFGFFPLRIRCWRTDGMLLRCKTSYVGGCRPDTTCRFE